jgi:hypothetical protein
MRSLLLAGASLLAISTAQATTYSYTGAMQSFVVATTGSYNILALGAQGGADSGYGGRGGQGAKVAPGDVLDFAVAVKPEAMAFQLLLDAAPGERGDQGADGRRNSPKDRPRQDRPVLFPDPAIMDHGPVEVLFHQALNGDGLSPLCGGEVAIGIYAEGLDEVINDEAGIPELAALMLDPGRLLLGPGKGCGDNNRAVRYRGHPQEGIKLEAEGAKRNHLPISGQLIDGQIGHERFPVDVPPFFSSRQNVSFPAL